MTSPFDLLDELSEAPALVDAESGRTWSRGELAVAVNDLAARMAGPRSLAFCLCARDVASVVGYLAAVRAGHPVVLLDRALAEGLTQTLINRFQPRFVLGTGELQERKTQDVGLHPDLAVLLSTSGTTGSPKLVRLTARNLETNAAAIAAYLRLGPDERAIASLPFHYSYGLSVLNSHLAAGASVLLTTASIIRPEFWEHAALYGATSFAGVPYSYTMLERTGLLRKAAPATLRTITQAGGRLEPDEIVSLHHFMRQRDGRLYVMYGQTEATARISYVPPDRLPGKAGTIGVAIPGGELSVEPDTSELIYRGPNVMLGYAEQIADLALGDVQKGVLPTGDLGARDEDGFFYITGRIKRIAKVFGLRVNLDEVESAARAHGTVAAIDGGDRIVVLAEDADPDIVRAALAERFRVNRRAFDVQVVGRLPVKTSGKIDYAAIEALNDSRSTG